MHFKLLLADDDMDDVDLFRQAVELSGLPISVTQIRYCADVFKAIADNNLPDVIVTGGSLLDRDMSECIAAVKEDKRLRELPLFALTGHSSPTVKENTLAAGIDGYFEKPVNLQELVIIVTKIYEVSLSKMTI